MLELEAVVALEALGAAGAAEVAQVAEVARASQRLATADRWKEWELSEEVADVIVERAVRTAEAAWAIGTGVGAAQTSGLHNKVVTRPPATNWLSSKPFLRVLAHLG